MFENSYMKSVRIVCINCKQEITGIQDENGKTKICCPHCGTVTVSKVMGRRHIQLDVYAPRGQYLMQ